MMFAVFTKCITVLALRNKSKNPLSHTILKHTHIKYKCKWLSNKQFTDEFPNDENQTNERRKTLSDFKEDNF